MTKNNPKKVIIFGTGGFAEVVHYYLTHDSPYEVAAFSATRDSSSPAELLSLPVVPFETLEENFPPSDFSMFIAIGYRKVNAIRTDFYRRAKEKGYQLITYVNSKATTWGDLSLGDNTFVFENNVIQPYTKIGNNVILWSGNHIGHHVRIADNCFITSHVVVSGNCTVGENCFLGVNATIGDGVKVAPRCVIGAGSLILRDTTEGAVFKAQKTEPAPFKSDELKNF